MTQPTIPEIIYKPNPSENLPSQWYLIIAYTYEADTGIFFKNYKEHKGFLKNGKLHMVINNLIFPVDKLIWKYMTGDEPKHIIHLDDDKRNNKWENLAASNTKTKNKENE